MDVEVVPLHYYKKYMSECCKLINDEWKRSETARMRSLDCSCDALPTSLILLEKDTVIGHVKLSPIPSIKEACFVESVVIQRGLRGKGFGRILMEKSEDYCKNYLQLNSIYLSTRGQEGFYSKLGYLECPPVSIYGGCTPITSIFKSCNNNNIENNTEVPKAPPLPIFNVNSNNSLTTKTYMKKDL